MKKNDEISILIIDDDPVNLQILGTILEGKGYNTAAAPGGKEGLAYLENEHPDLVLLDVMMPDINGYDTCRAIKNNEDLKEIPVIFLTAKAESRDVIEGFEAGGVDYITKPFQEKELTARIRTHLELKLSREEIRLKNRELEQALTNLEKAVRTDHLTGLFNRRHISEMLEQEKARAERNDNVFSILLLDIDRFKNINDTYGHDFGDRVLIAVGDILSSTIRGQDTSARWGGEEFMILLPETGADGAGILAEKLRQAIEACPLEHEGDPVHVTATFGVALFDKGMETDTIIKQADQALYRGKEEGRNRVVQFS